MLGALRTQMIVNVRQADAVRLAEEQEGRKGETYNSMVRRPVGAGGGGGEGGALSVADGAVPDPAAPAHVLSRQSGRCRSCAPWSPRARATL